MFRFTIRDVLWLTVDPALAACIIAVFLILLAVSSAR
jgi:hypothetical protein